MKRRALAFPQYSKTPLLHHSMPQREWWLPRNEWAEGVPGFGPFAFALPKLSFEVSQVTGITFHLV